MTALRVVICVLIASLLVTALPTGSAEGPDDALVAGEAAAGYCYAVQPWSMPPVMIYECPTG